MSCCLPCLLADRIEYRNGTRQLHSTQDYGLGRAAEQTSLHLPRIEPASPVCSATMEHGFLQRLSCPGACTHARIHLPSVTTLPASDSVLRAFFLRLCSTARLCTHFDIHALHAPPGAHSLSPLDSKTPNPRQVFDGTGKVPSPNLTCIFLQLIRRQQHHTACSPPLPHMGALRGDGARAVRCWLLPGRHQGM